MAAILKMEPFQYKLKPLDPVTQFKSFIISFCSMKNYKDVYRAK